MKKQLENTLLYQLDPEEIDQIINDYECFNTIKFCFNIDAYDIQKYIDPFDILYKKYNKNEISLSKKLQQDLVIRADKFFALDTLFVTSKHKNYLLKEYKVELNQHKNQFNSHRKNYEMVLNILDGVDHEKIESYISENFSEFYFLLSGYSISVSDRFKKLVDNKLIKTNVEYEEKFFSNLNPFQEEDRERIVSIYNLFKKKSYADFLDAVAIYKVFILNDKNIQGKRFIYFSSASKSYVVLEKIKLLLEENHKDWIWLKNIVKKHQGEKLLFFRNDAYYFGFYVYKTLLKQNLEYDKDRYNRFFRLACLNRKFLNESAYIDAVSSLIFKQREVYENFTVFYERFDFIKKLEASSIKHKNSRQLLNKIQALINNIGEKNNLFEALDIRISDAVLSFDIIETLWNFCCLGTEMEFDRGNDKVISLFNTIPPLFILNRKKFPDSEKKSLLQNNVEGLILFASLNETEESRVDLEKIIDLLHECKTNRNDYNDLLYIFLLMFIKYTEKEKDSNELAFEYSERKLSEIENKYEKFKDFPHKFNKEDKFLIQELNVLKLWAFRRVGHKFSNHALDEIDRQHKNLKKLYNEDYRFKTSHFLSRIDFLYPFIKGNSDNLDLIINYVNQTINFGNDARHSLMESNYKTDAFTRRNYLTLTNSLCFSYCVKLDLILYKESRKSPNTFNSIKLIKISNINEIYKNLVGDDGLKYKRKENFKTKHQNSSMTYEEYLYKHPVFAYVEAYVEYLEAHLNINNKEKKIKEALKALRIGMSAMRKDSERRPLLIKSFEILEKILEEFKTQKNKLTNSYSCFILKLDAK
ncbi:hypothetical protein [Kordia sp.]|uniref:hypothetical protein n=1 Tax=Kordia sp. TaxID=1965332 RepID=UPI003D6C51CD